MDAETVLSNFELLNDGQMSRLMEGVLHGDGKESEEASTTREVEWYGIDQEKTEEWKTTLAKNSEEAKSEKMTANWLRTLEYLLQK